MIYNRRDVLRIIAKTLDCSEDQLTNESGLTRTLNWDSLNHVMILSSIEDYFDIKIIDEKFPILTSIEKIMKYLDEYQRLNCINDGKCECGNSCYSEKRITFTGKGGIKLVGIYCFTKQEPKGFILFSHGIPSEKDEAGLHRNMATYFAQGGYDSFRFDFRYMGESEPGSESLLSIDNMIDDLESAYNISLHNPFDEEIISRDLKNSNQFMVGTSCGSGVILKWINKYYHSKSIKSVFLCCPVLDYVYECTGIEKANIAVQENKILLDIDRLGYIDDRDTKYGKRFFENALQFDIDYEAEKYKGKIVIFHGNKDQFIPIEISKRFEIAHKKYVDMIEIDWARHGFGLPLVDKAGNSLTNEVRYKLKMKNQGDIIHSIFCSIRGVDNADN